MAVSSSKNGRILHWLRCSVQTYEWGRIGLDSKVARLYWLNSGAAVDNEKPYAEFWMGTHGSGPSFLRTPLINGGSVMSDKVPLKYWILQNPAVLGEKVLKKWGGDLPFLFKILSVEKALSIQAHPDKESARKLHKLLPDVYRDENHKPEMALAITKFEALCGFISLKELRAVIQTVPEVVELVGSALANKLSLSNERDGKATLKSLFTQLMCANLNMISEALSKLKSRLNTETKVRRLSDKEELVLRLERQYPDDVGVISAFFLNYVKLRPGEALYLGANEPHAYLSGDCVECMATSDNIVRAGLTPKHRDIPTLCSMLTYEQGYPEILKGVQVGRYTRKYQPPFDEFEVDECTLPKCASAVFPACAGPSIFAVTDGRGAVRTPLSEDALREGDVVFVPAGVPATVAAMPGSSLKLYRAGVNTTFLSPF